MVPGIALNVTNVVVAIVASNIGAPVLASDELEPDRLGCVSDSSVEIRGPEPNVTYVHQLDHVVSAKVAEVAKGIASAGNDTGRATAFNRDLAAPWPRRPSADPTQRGRQILPN
jgi:hypothetical protein